MSIAIGATVIALGGGAYGIVSATANTGSGTATTASTSATSGTAHPRRRRIQRSIWTGRGRICRRDE